MLKDKDYIGISYVSVIKLAPAGRLTNSAWRKEEVMGYLIFFVIVLALIAVLVLLVTQSRTEVKPATALVYNNMWTGQPDVVFPGTGFIVPGIHRILEREVSLKNEAENPSNVNLITGDGIELEVDYIVRRLQVGCPNPEKTTNWEDLKKCVIKAVTIINYSGRRDKILTRIVARLQEALQRRTVNELFSEIDVKTGKRGKVNKEVMQTIETEVNTKLRDDIVTTEWGFWVEIDLEDYNLPIVIRKAREQRSSAEIAGSALKEKATAAGVKPEWLIVGEALSSIFGNRKKGGDKE
ncbi:SPFH domain-containing protein [Patescibacteria group bacterium]|nr:SPFH domain-containing protein [Patescibacteria group bacterium]